MLCYDGSRETCPLIEILMRLHLLTVVLLLSGCTNQSVEGPAATGSAPATAAPDVTQPQPAAVPAVSLPEGNYVTLGPARIDLILPEQFERAKAFQGFKHRSLNASVMAHRVKGNFSEKAVSYTSAGMQARGLTLRSREDLQLDGLPALLVLVDQPGEPPVSKWMLLLADSRENTATVTATFPRSAESEVSPLLKAILLSVRRTRSLPGPYVHFPSIGIEMKRPPGFKPGPDFAGFSDQEGKSSLMAVRIPAKFDEATADFASERLEAQGVHVAARENVEVDGIPALLISMEQTLPGVKVKKKVLAFADGEDTVAITATWPEEADAELAIPLNTAILGVKKSATPADPTADIPFTLTATGKLKPTRSISGMLAFTDDGNPHRSDSPAGKPLLRSGPAIEQNPPEDKQAYAEGRARHFPGLKVEQLTSVEPVTIDGLEGYEIVAPAEDRRSKTPLILYEVILYHGNANYALLGTAAADQAEAWLPEFKSLARSFRLKH